MATIQPDRFDAVTPSPAEAKLALESSRQLAARKLGRKAGVRLQLLDGGTDEPVTVPASALKLFVQILQEMSRGNAVTLIPVTAELTTQQAADLLNVSRPYVVRLLVDGKIPSRTVGKYRRVRLDDLLEYKRKDDEARARVLDELSAEAQEMGMGY